MIRDINRGTTKRGGGRSDDRGIAVLAWWNLRSVMRFSIFAVPRKARTNRSLPLHSMARVSSSSSRKYAWFVSALQQQYSRLGIAWLIWLLLRVRWLVRLCIHRHLIKTRLIWLCYTCIVRVHLSMPSFLLESSVCVCFLPIHSGHQVRWTYQPGSHRRKVTQDF